MADTGPEARSFHAMAYDSGGIGIVKLQRIRPAGEIRIAAISQQQVARPALRPGVILRRAGEIEFVSPDKILGMVFDPGVTEAHMVRDEVEDQDSDDNGEVHRVGNAPRMRKLTA